MPKRIRLALYFASYDSFASLGPGRTPAIAPHEKGAAKVTVSARRVLLELAVVRPFANELRRITQNLSKSLSLNFE